jgi:RNA polymerase sigma factor (sigma-70 family)
MRIKNAECDLSTLKNYTISACTTTFKSALEFLKHADYIVPTVSINRFLTLAAFALSLATTLRAEPAELCARVYLEPGFVHTLGNLDTPHLRVDYIKTRIEESREFYNRRLNKLIESVQREGNKENEKNLILVLMGSVYPFISSQMRNYYNEHAALDLMQDSLLRFMEAVRTGKYDPSHEYANPVNYLFKTAQNVVETYIRSERRRRGIINENPSEIPSVHGVDASSRWRFKRNSTDAENLHDLADTNPVDMARKMDSEVLAQVLNDAINSLPSRERQIFEMHIIEGRTLTEIAPFFDVTRACVGMICARAVRKLRRYLRMQKAVDDLLLPKTAKDSARRGRSISVKELLK